ncbi:hypothetical protein HDU97_009082 [Phlyctochytrium planicorne]|nr:hypothetical protein HDU97_009082 [Phlyctochytrium planicorne]
MEVEATFKNGSKRLLIALLNAVKDFNKPNSLSLRFSQRGITARFACGPPMHPLQSIIMFTLDASEDDSGSSASLTDPAAAAASSASDSLPVEAPPPMPTPSTSPIPGSTPKERKASTASIPPGLLTAVSVKANSSLALIPGSRAGTSFSGLKCRTETIITVHPRTLFHQLELVDDGDLISIRGEKTEEGNVPIYELYFESGDHGRKVLYEMDAVPHVEPIPPMVTIPKYNFVVQIESEEFRRTIAALHETSEKGSKNSITFCSTGPIGTLQVGLVQKQTPPNKIPRFKVLSFTSPIRLTFDSRFLRGFTIATPLSTYVTLSFGGPQTPLKVTYPIEQDTLQDGTVRLASLAPVHPTSVGSVGAPASPTSGTGVSLPEVEDVGEGEVRESPVGSPVKVDSSVDRAVVGRLEYYLLPERVAQ